jgi:hypothetical protein
MSISLNFDMIPSREVHPFASLRDILPDPETMHNPQSEIPTDLTG